MVFLTLCFTELFRCFTVRRFRSWFGHRLSQNRALIGAALTSFAIVLFVTLVPGPRDLFSLKPIPAARWGIVFLIAFLIAVIDEMIKAPFQRRSIEKRRWIQQQYQLELILAEVRSLRLRLDGEVSARKLV